MEMCISTGGDNTSPTAARHGGRLRPGHPARPAGISAAGELVGHHGPGPARLGNTVALALVGPPGWGIMMPARASARSVSKDQSSSQPVTVQVHQVHGDSPRYDASVSGGFRFKFTKR